MTLPAHRFRDREGRAKPKQDSGGNIAFDLDGTISSFPAVFQTLIAALTAAGRQVYILSGAGDDKAQPGEQEAKVQYLRSLGIGPELYHELIVVPNPHKNKARVIQEKNIGIFFDNNKQNVKAAAPYCVALLVWNSREK